MPRDRLDATPIATGPAGAGPLRRGLPGSRLTPEEDAIGDPDDLDDEIDDTLPADLWF